jgi:hypothetical protein
MPERVALSHRYVAMPLTLVAPPSQASLERVDQLIRGYRPEARATLEPLVETQYPALGVNRANEYRKMVELSTKMTLVGHAATESLGYEFDARRRRIASLFGGCCFLADSFIDDFGEEAAYDYLDRFEVLLTRGWFHPRTNRERLFYTIITRLFLERDVLRPILRQALLQLYEAQRRDVAMRSAYRHGAPGRVGLRQLKLCARDRSGHAILVLSSFLVPDIALPYRAPVFAAGSLIMHIDDHGDCYADLKDGRVTFMNQVQTPARVLRRIFAAEVTRLMTGLPANAGRDLFVAFLTRYYLTRLEKHRKQQQLEGSAWAVYE